MRAYVLKRVILMIPTLFIVSLVSFAIVNAMPGDAITARLLESPSFRPEDLQEKREALGLNDPLYLQYLEWLGGVLRGDFGNSLWSEQPVTNLLKDAVPVTAELAILAFLLTIVLATVIGVLSAVRQDGPLDYSLRLVSIAGLSIPSFWLGILFVVLAARWFNYLSPLTYTPFYEDPIENLKQFLPGAVIIAIGSSAGMARITRSAMLEVLRQDYIRTAWAKGLRERAIIVRHALKNALIPVVTVAGAQVGVLLGGSVIAENIFTLPGMGQLLLRSVTSRDFITIQAITLWIAAAVVVMNLVVDVLYAYLDPRIRY